MHYDLTVVIGATEHIPDRTLKGCRDMLACQYAVKLKLKIIKKLLIKLKIKIKFTTLYVAVQLLLSIESSKNSSVCAILTEKAHKLLMPVPTSPRCSQAS